MLEDSLLENTISGYNFLNFCSGLEGVSFVSRTHRAYFQREKLNSSIPKYLQAMVLTNTSILVGVVVSQFAIIMHKMDKADDKIWV